MLINTEATKSMFNKLHVDSVEIKLEHTIANNYQIILPVDRNHKRKYSLKS